MENDILHLVNVKDHSIKGHGVDLVCQSRWSIGCLLAEVAELDPLVQGGRRGGSIYGTGRVIFSLQEGHGSSGHPHTRLKSTSSYYSSRSMGSNGPREVLSPLD